MGLIAQEGYFKGVIVDGGVGESSGGFPQAVMALRADEIYDVESDTWVQADPDANEYTYYGVLFGKNDKETLNSKQVKKVTGWDGASWDSLEESMPPETPIQFRTEYSEYEGKTRLQVSWIDPIGASPSRGVNKLDSEGKKKLQSKYASILAATKDAPKPKSAEEVKAEKEAAKAAKAEAAAKKKADKEAKAAAKAAAEATPEPEKESATLNALTGEDDKPARPSRPSIPKAAAKGTCTADEAWDACAKLVGGSITEDNVTEAWLAAVVDLSPGGDESQATDETWFAVKEAIKAKFVTA